MRKIIGIDEVGRGCWAGPLVAAAVLLHGSIDGLADSKKLTKQQREILALQIRQNGQVGLGWVSAADIDKLGLTAATSLAMQQAISQINSLDAEIIIDGAINYLAGLPHVKTLIKADATIQAVSAASIVAKVARDQYMTEQAKHFPHYQFEKHVGYGTKLHTEMLKLHGLCELHRLSYKPIKALL